ncbi:hypothetical protein Bca4012_050849 [Brassica carinata]
MYKQKGIRCSDAPAKSTTGSMDKLAKGTSYAGNCDPKFFSTKSCEMLPKHTSVSLSFLWSQNWSLTLSIWKLINRQHPKSIQFSRVMASANCFTIGYSRVIKKRRDGFTYGLAEKRGKPLSLKYSLEELQTMVDDMDYGLRLTIRTVSRRVL